MASFRFLTNNQFQFSVLILLLASTNLFANDTEGKTELEKVFSERSQLERITEQGLVRGFESKLNTLTWQGIPFAKPPLGELRWKAPRPPEMREQTLNANNNNAMCLQKAGPLTTLNALTWNDVIGSEDCLYLNITAPKDLAEGEHLPVMFWIHGGGNSIGYKGNAAYTGEDLSAKGRVILVSVNYRLGPLGWFLHPALVNTSDNPADKSGNFGTLDLIEALKWTRSNIAYFNGNPDNITVFGESAGGTDTYSLLASAQAKNLFQRAIVESGAYNPSTQAFASLPNNLGGHLYSSSEIVNKILVDTKMAENENDAQVKQNNSHAKALAKTLRDYDGKALVALYPTFAAGMLTWPGISRDGFVIPFEDSKELFANTKSFNSMPIMLGTNRDENKTFLALDPNLVSFGFRVNDQEKYQRTAQYLANNWKINGVDNNARVLAESQGKIYAYRFDWDELPTIGWVNLSEMIGAGHGLEIPFVFGSFKSDFNLDLLFGSDTQNRRQKLSDAMMSYWTNFAYTGDPAKGRNNELPEWAAWDNENKANKFIVLDAGENGIQMSNHDLYEYELKTQLEHDESISENEERCALFKALFIPKDLSHYDLNEYLNFGKATGNTSCEAFPL